MTRSLSFSPQPKPSSALALWILSYFPFTSFRSKRQTKTIMKTFRFCGNVASVSLFRQLNYRHLVVFPLLGFLFRTIERWKCNKLYVFATFCLFIEWWWMVSSWPPQLSPKTHDHYIDTKEWTLFFQWSLQPEGGTSCKWANKWPW